jgi:hypothetical protein
LILGIYHLLFEREKMHQFKRFFLLFGLGFSLIVPLITIRTVFENTTTQVLNIQETTIIETSIFTLENILMSLYVIGVLLFLVRIGYQIISILKHAYQSEKTLINGAKLVLLNQNTLPYTFGNYIFVSKNAYQEHQIDAQLLTHELTHVRQKHSFDIILIECIQALYWFNPILIWYKKAIQVNHEFLADERVVETHHQVKYYQKLLLDTIQSQKTLQLVSNLNFSITKMRLKMMTKTTSHWRTKLLAIASVPFFIGLLLLFGNEAIAQSPKTKKAEKTIKFDKDAYFKNATFIIEQKDGKILKKPYNKLSAQEKASIPPPPPPPESGKKIKLKPLGKGTVIHLSHDGKVKINSKNGNGLPPPPPPPAPKSKKAPKAPKAPSAPKAPKAPSAPSAASAPSVPTAPTAPTAKAPKSKHKMKMKEKKKAKVKKQTMKQEKKKVKLEKKG